MLTKPNAAAFKLLLLVLFVAALAGCRPPGPRALLDGKRLLEKGKPVAAVARLEVATQLMATNADAWNYLGIAYHQSGSASNAVAAYGRALSLNPDLVETRLNLGTLWLELGRPSEAKSEFTAYNLRRPSAPEGFGKIALAELHLKETAAADQHIRKSLQLDNQNPESWNTMGLVQLQQGRSRDAANSFGSALQLDPECAPALINLAVVLQQQLGRPSEALKVYHRYLALQPPPPDAGEVERLVQQIEQQLQPAAAETKPGVPSTPPAAARPAAKVVAEVPPKQAVSAPPSVAPDRPKTAPVQASTPAPTPREQPVAVPTRVVVAPDVKIAPVVEVKPPAATPSVKSIPNSNRPTPVASASANATVSASRTPADADASNAPERKPGVTPLPPPRNTVFVEAKPAAERASDPDAAADLSKSRVRSKAEGYAVKGRKAMAARRYVEAAEAYRAATKADPTWFQAQFNLAAAAIEAGLNGEAVSASERALAIKPDSSDARYNYGLALKQGGRYAQAAAQLEQVVTADPINARAHLTLGNLYADQLREPDNARLHYLKVLEIDPGHSQAGAILFWLKENPAR